MGIRFPPLEPGPVHKAASPIFPIDTILPIQRLLLSFLKNLSIMISSVGKKHLSNRSDGPAKTIVDKSEKQSIMNISTEDNNV